MVNKFCLGSIDFKGCEVERYNIEEINILQIFKKASFVEHLKRLLFSQPKSSNYLLQRERERERETERERDRRERDRRERDRRERDRERQKRETERETEERETEERETEERDRERQRERQRERPRYMEFHNTCISNSYLNLEIFTSVLVLVLHKMCLRHDFSWLTKNIMISCKDYNIMQ